MTIPEIYQPRPIGKYIKELHNLIVILERDLYHKYNPDLYLQVNNMRAELRYYTNDAGRGTNHKRYNKTVFNRKEWKPIVSYK